MKWFNKILLLLVVLLCFLCFVIKQKPKPYNFPVIKNFPSMPLAADNLVTVEGALLGRYLFYDPILSADSSISCASCHQQQNAFSDSPNKFSLGIKKQIQKRNTMALFNLAWYSKMFWDGRAASIEAQVFYPINHTSEMGLKTIEAIKKLKRSGHYRKLFYDAFRNYNIDSVSISNAIGQFERTLLSYNSKFDKAIRKEEKFSTNEIEGYELVNDMTKGNCLHCHTTDGDGLGTTGGFSNNGLDAVSHSNEFIDKGLGGITKKEFDNGKFKIPSLRNLIYTAPYMHDGRFKTLEDVLDFYSSGLNKSPTIDTKMEFVHKGGSNLTPIEKEKIICFLKTMSDSFFISNKEFSNPF
jgi:cytochrome c peroxidase